MRHSVCLATRLTQFQENRLFRSNPIKSTPRVNPSFWPPGCINKGMPASDSRIAALRRSGRREISVEAGSGDRVSVVTGFDPAPVAAKGAGGPRRAPVSIDRRKGVERAGHQREEAVAQDAPTPPFHGIASPDVSGVDAGPVQDFDDAA